MIYLFILLIAWYLFFPSKKVKFGFFHLKRNLIPIGIILLFISLVIFSEDVFQSAHNGLVLWMNNVVPSLFPFLICLELLKQTNIISMLGKILEPITRTLFRIPGSGAFAIALGICSGYPVGAKITSSLREENQCSKVEGERLLAFTNTSGPLFIVGSVGVSMFFDSKVGFLLLLTHFVAALLVGIIFRFYPFIGHSKKTPTFASHPTSETSSSFQSEPKKRIRLSELGSIMGNGIRNSVSTLLLICGFLVFFSVLGTILDKIGITNWISDMLQNAFILLGFSEETAKEMGAGIFKGILEITGAVKMLSNISVDRNLLLPFVAMLLGFGGISVHMQVASIVSHTDLSIYPYLLGKTLHGILAGFFTYLVLQYTNFFQLEAIETFSSITVNQMSGVTGSGNLLLMTLGGILLICLFLFLFPRKSLQK